MSNLKNFGWNAVAKKENKVIVETVNTVKVNGKKWKKMDGLREMKN